MNGSLRGRSAGSWELTVDLGRDGLDSLHQSHARVALQAEQSIVVVSKRPGHSNLSIASYIYAHSLPGWQRQAAEAFADAMDRARSREGSWRGEAQTP